MKYKIVRRFENRNRRSKVIKTGLTLAEARKHCNDPATRKESTDDQYGWFDSYRKEGE